MVRERKRDKYLGLRPWTRHSTVLLVAGAFYFILGLLYILGRNAVEAKSAAYLFSKWFDLNWLGSVWMFVGTLTIISTVWPPISKTWGYSIMTGLSAAWASFYAVDIVFMDGPVWQINGALMWGFIAFMWWAISGLVDPEKR